MDLRFTRFTRLAMSSLGEAQVHNFIAVCAAWLMLVTPVAVFEETLVGKVVKVVKVADGDTVTVLDADQVQHRVRLAGIDAPESNQRSEEHTS